jgi:Tfp pilus assembly PilM family ATPase
MSAASRLPSWLTPSPVDLAIEISSRRVTVAQVAATAVAACGSEPLPPEAITPQFIGPNVELRQVVLGVKPAKRVALVVPDSIARVTLVSLEHVPEKAADLKAVLDFHVKKATPFPLDEARVGHTRIHADAAATTFAVVVTRLDVLSQYEAIPSALGMHAGIVELASFNMINAVLASPAPPGGDWLLVSIAAEATTLAIVRGSTLMFYRQRPTVDNEPLSALVHQTAMYHEDRMGGTAFSRVVLCGAAQGSGGAERVRSEIAARLGLPAEGIDARATAAVRTQLSSAPDLLDALAAPVGLLLRERQVA